jgi:hypothetical protein
MTDHHHNAAAILQRLTDAATPKTISLEDEPDHLADWQHLVTTDPAARRAQDEITSLRTALNLVKQQLAIYERPASYKEFIRSDAWAAIREAAVERADRRCQICYSADHLQVHHRTYERFGGDELPTDLTVLCDGCHDAFHKTRRIHHDAAA